jgi:hypothetical protein
MFDDNNIDKMMKSILENAQEEVPAHVWEGVSAGLEKTAKRKAVVIWFRRAAIGAAAAAIIIVAGLIFTRGGAGQIPQSSDPQSEDFIAVVEKPSADTASVNRVTPPAEVLLAEVKSHESRPSSVYYKPSSVHHTPTPVHHEPSSEIQTSESITEEKTIEKFIEQTCDPVEAEEVEHYFEEPVNTKKLKTSLTLSGITGTNSITNSTRSGIQKRPALVAGSAKTGITETSSNTTYSLPVSAGVGVKLDFNDRWSLGVGVNYSYLSRKFYGTYIKTDENGTVINSTASDVRNAQHYIGIPLNAYYNILNNKHINFYTYAGGTVEKCISDKYYVLNTNIVHTEKPEGVQLSVNAGIGVEFMLGQHLGLYIDPSLRYYFDCDQPKSIRTTQPLMLGFEMGLRVIL